MKKNNESRLLHLILKLIISDCSLITHRNRNYYTQLLVSKKYTWHIIVAVNTTTYL